MVESIAIEETGDIWIGAQDGVYKMAATKSVNCNYNTYLSKREYFLQSPTRYSTEIAKTKCSKKEIRFDGAVWTYYTTANGMANYNISSIALEDLGLLKSNDTNGSPSPGSEEVSPASYKTGEIKNIQSFLNLPMMWSI